MHTWFQQLDATTLAQARKQDGTPLVPADKAGDMVKQLQLLMKVQQRATGGARGTGARRVGFDSPVDLGLPGDLEEWLRDNGTRIGDVVLGTLDDGTIVGRIERLTNFASRFIVKSVEDAFDVVALLFYRYAATFQEVIHSRVPPCGARSSRAWPRTACRWTPRASGSRSRPRADGC